MVEKDVKKLRDEVGSIKKWAKGMEKLEKVMERSFNSLIENTEYKFSKDIHHLIARMDKFDSDLSGMRKEVDILRKERDYLMKTNKQIIRKVVAEGVPQSGGVVTPIDELFELVVKKGSVTIESAAKIFKVSEEDIESWAKILEEHDLIEVHFPPIGKPVLKRKE